MSTHYNQFSNQFGNTNNNAFGLDYTKIGDVAPVVEGIDAFDQDFGIKTPTISTPGVDKGSSWSLWGGKVDGQDTNSIVGTGLGLAGAGLDAYLGLKQLGVAEDALDFQKGAFSKQFGAQKALTEASLRDRQAARVSASPTSHKSVEQYMAEVNL